MLEDYKNDVINITGLTCDVSDYLLKNTSMGTEEYKIYQYVLDTMVESYLELAKNNKCIN